VADRTVSVQLNANVTGFRAQMTAAASSARQFGTQLGRSIQQNSAQIDTLANRVGALGAGLAGIAGLAVKKFADFDQAMSGVAATGEDARKSIDALRAAAMEAGERTVFSATEAANAITELAKANVSATDILSGGLDGALDLAAAGGIEVAKAAEIASQTMNQFNLEGDQATRIADVLAASAGKAAGEVGDFGLAMKYVGPVASQLGVSLEETSGTLALLAQNGILADSAGTGLRGVLMALTSPTAAAQKELDKYNISAFDAQGKFVGLESLAGQLQQRLGGLTEAERSAALGRMFGNEQITTARILYAEGADAIRDWTDQVDDQGYAAETAATKLDNLKGDIEALGGAFDTALIKTGESANGPLRDLVQGVTDVVNAYSSLPSGVQAATMAIVGGGGLVLLGVAGMAKLSVATVETIAAMQSLNLMSSTTAAAVSRNMGKAAKVAGGAALAIGGAFLAMSSRPDDAGKGTKELAADLGKVADGAAVVDSIFSRIDTENGAWGFFSGDNAVDDFSKFIDQASQTGWLQSLEKGFTGVTEGLADFFVGADIRTEWTKQYDTLQAFGDELGTLASTDLPSASAAFRELFEQAGGTAADGQQLLKLMPALKDELIGVADSSGLATDDATLLAIALGEVGPAAQGAAAATDENASAVDRLVAAQDAGTFAVDGYTDALKELVEQQREAAGVVLSTRDAQRSYQEAIDAAAAAAKENGNTLDSTTEKGRANAAALDAIAESGWDLIDSMRESGSSQEDLQAKVQKVRDQFLKQASAMGMSKSAAEDLADELGLIPESIDVQVAVDTTRATRYINDWLIKNDGQRIRVYVDAQGGREYRVPGTDVRFNATGGAILGPGTGTSDSIPAMLSNGEHVLTASDVEKAGGQGAIYRLRAAIQGGLLRFAAGGAVGDARRAVSSADAARDAAWRKYKSSGRDADMEAWTAARERWLAAVERLERLLDQRQEAIVDARRGDTMSDATSGLSGAYGLVDQLRGLAGNEDLSKSQRESFARRANQAEAAFKKLYGQADRIEERLAAARDRVQELSSIKASASSALQGGFGLSGMFGQKDAYGYDVPVTGRSILAGAKQYASKLRAFGSKLSAVQKKLGPASGVILQELIGLGVEQGTVAADGILSLSQREATELTTAFGDIKKYSDQAGEIVTRGFYNGGLSAAEGVVDGLERDADKIAKKIERLARQNADAIRRALGLDPLPRQISGSIGSSSATSAGVAVASAPRPMSPVAMPVPAASAGAGTFTDAQIDRMGDRMGNQLKEAWVQHPPRAIYAPDRREVGRLYQSGKIAYEGLGQR